MQFLTCSFGILEGFPGQSKESIEGRRVDSLRRSWSLLWFIFVSFDIHFDFHLNFFTGRWRRCHWVLSVRTSRSTLMTWGGRTGINMTSMMMVMMMAGNQIILRRRWTPGGHCCCSSVCLISCRSSSSISQDVIDSKGTYGSSRCLLWLHLPSYRSLDHNLDMIL